MRTNQNQVTDSIGAETPKIGVKQVIAPGSTPEEALQQIYDAVVEILGGSGSGKERRYQVFYFQYHALHNIHYCSVFARNSAHEEDLTDSFNKPYENFSIVAMEVCKIHEALLTLADNLPAQFSFIRPKPIINLLNENFMETTEKKPKRNQDRLIERLGKSPEETILLLSSMYEKWKEDFVVDDGPSFSFDLLQDGFAAYSFLEEEDVPRHIVQNAMNNWNKSAIFFKEIGQLLDTLPLIYKKKEQQTANE